MPIPGPVRGKDAETMAHALQPLDSGSLEDLIGKMPEKAILLLGDIMLDRFVYGDVHRISPEGPIPVLSIQREIPMMGGAGNVLANLHGLGIKARIISVVGQDEEAGILRTMVSGCGANQDSLLVAQDRPTTVKTRFVASGQQLLRTDREHAEPVAEAVQEQIVAAATRAMASIHAVILCDYAKGVLTKSVIQSVIAAARKAGVPVLVDPKARDFSLYKGADIITPNRKELETASNMPTSSDDEVAAASRATAHSSGIPSIVTTRSQDGMTIFHENQLTHLKAQAREVFDVSGAGDTVIACIAAGLAAGGDLRQAAAIANIAAGIVVGKVGTAPISRDELLTVVKEQLSSPHRAHQGRIASWDEAAEQVAHWRARGLKIGFTNGAFDILHSGHVTYLKQARSRCDRLIVGLNCDESIRRYKSKDRPVNNVDSRSRVLSALGCVDMVVVFGETPEENDTPLELIKTLNPDLLVKGADYTIDKVVGADHVLSTGGEVWLAPLEEGKSTTNIIRKMAGAG